MRQPTRLPRFKLLDILTPRRVLVHPIFKFYTILLHFANHSAYDAIENARKCIGHSRILNLPLSRETTFACYDRNNQMLSAAYRVDESMRLL